MSSILKALQRVNQERPAGAANAPRRALRGDFVPEEGKPLLRRSRRLRLTARVWGSLGAALLVAAFVWWRLPERVEPEEPPATLGESAGADEAAGAPPPVAEQAAPLAVAPPAAAPPAPAPPTEPVAPAAEAPVAEVPMPPVEPAPAPAPPSQEAPQPAVPIEVAERLPPLGATLDAAPQVEPAQPPPAPPSEPEPAAVPEPELAAATEAAPVPAREEPAAAPAQEPTPPSAVEARAAPPAEPPARPAPRKAAAAKRAPPRAASAPAVLVERTSWHPKAERRVAWVSVEGIKGPRELHEGDAVGAFVVKEIRPSSVVFLHGADTLQRRVGERE